MSNDYYYLLSLFFLWQSSLSGPNETVLMQRGNTFVRMLLSYQGPILKPCFFQFQYRFSITRFYTVVWSALWLV